MSRQRMSFNDALDLVPDDMPDGAAFAMAHEIAGLDYGDGFDELGLSMSDLTGRPKTRRAGPTVFKLTPGLRKKIEQFGTVRQNDAYHWQVREKARAGRGRVLADWWPHKQKWRIGAVVGTGPHAEFVEVLRAAITMEKQL
ncbi:MAG: hypothetical protein GC182_09005 [Rhodopseudomonas sp.]|nr:hypothetical protein [Rhodopseudomonas sp.]